MSKSRFDCDRQSKYDFVSSTTEYVRTQGYEGKLDFYELDNEWNLIPFGSSSVSTTAIFDAVILTDNNTYVVELKDRWNYSSTLDPAILEPYKYKNLLLAKKYGFIPLYAFLYNDGKIRIWKIEEGYEMTDIDASRYTVYDGPKIKKPEYILWNSGATMIPRLTAMS